MKLVADNRKLYGRGYDHKDSLVTTSIMFFTTSKVDAEQQAKKLIALGRYSRVDIMLGADKIAVIKPDYNQQK